VEKLRSSISEEFVKQRQRGWDCLSSDFELQAMGLACSIKSGGRYDALCAMKALCQLSASMLDEQILALQNEVNPILKHS
jgi:hypothetical protein